MEKGGILPKEDIFKVLTLPGVGYLFLLYLTRHEAGRERSPLKLVESLWRKARAWKSKEWSAAFQRFLKAPLPRFFSFQGPWKQRGGKYFSLFRKIFLGWARAGNVSPWTLGEVAFSHKVWLPPETIERLSLKCASNFESVENVPYAVRWIFFQSWWKRRHKTNGENAEENNPGREKNPLYAMIRLLEKCRRNKLSKSELHALKNLLGPLIFMLYPTGIDGRSVFECERELENQIEEGETRGFLQLFLSVYPEIVPRFGMCPWPDEKGDVPTKDINFFMKNLKAFQDCETLAPPRFMMVKKTGCDQIYTTALNSFVHFLLVNNGFDYKLKYLL